MKLYLHGKIECNRFLPENPEYFKNVFRSFEGKRVTLTVGRYRKPRSDMENRYYWGVVVNMISDAMGESDKEYVHEILKSLFLEEVKYKTVGDRQIKLKRVKSTTELSTVEMESYMESIRRWAASFLGVVIPEPNQTET